MPAGRKAKLTCCNMHAVQPLAHPLLPSPLWQPCCTPQATRAQCSSSSEPTHAKGDGGHDDGHIPVGPLALHILPLLGRQVGVVVPAVGHVNARECWELSVQWLRVQAGMKPCHAVPHGTAWMHPLHAFRRHGSSLPQAPHLTRRRPPGSEKPSMSASCPSSSSATRSHSARAIQYTMPHCSVECRDVAAVTGLGAMMLSEGAMMRLTLAWSRPPCVPQGSHQFAHPFCPPAHAMTACCLAAAWW